MAMGSELTTGLKVLIVEDDAIIRRMVEMHLSKWGYSCDTASDGEEAWKLFQNGDFDIIITDWMMPGMDGGELCRLIRRTSHAHYTYIIMLTSLDTKEDLAMGIAHGADDYIAKPMEPAELRARVKAGERIIRLERRLTDFNVRMRRELSHAANNLRNLLPTRGILAEKLRVEWYFQPSIYVGGDIFNVIKLDGSHIVLYSIDVTGHGLSAALLAVSLSHALRPIETHGGIMRRESEGTAEILSPKLVAQHLNERFPMDIETGMHFTLFYAVINVDDGTMRYIRAGHPKPLLIRDGEIKMLTPGMPPIGVVDNFKWHDETEMLKKGDRLVIYSDGLLETENDYEEQFGEMRLLAALDESHDTDLNRMLNRTVGKMEVFRGTREYIDDITLFGIELL